MYNINIKELRNPYQKMKSDAKPRGKKKSYKLVEIKINDDFIL